MSILQFYIIYIPTATQHITLFHNQIQHFGPLGLGILKFDIFHFIFSLNEILEQQED